MTGTTPVERVAHLLGSASYARIPVPIHISGLKFQFPAVFLGTGVSSDLLVVVDTAFDSEVRVTQQVEALARSLDVMQSSPIALGNSNRPSSKHGNTGSNVAPMPGASCR